MTRGTDQLQLGASFSPSLKTFLGKLIGTDWSAKCPDCLFIRDFEDLPETAPFDIDLLCGREDWPTLTAIVRDAAAECGLLVSVYSSELALYLLVLDVDGPVDQRRHAFFEVRHTLDLGAFQFALRPSGNIVLRTPDIARKGGPGLPVPKSDWHCALLYLQALRKPDTAKYLRRISIFGSNDRDAARGLLASRLGFEESQLEAWLATPAPIARRQPQPTPAFPPDRRTRLRAFCASYLFFFPLLKLDFYTLHGPDGVGKSTTCDTIEKLFEGLPVGLHKFHHSEGWKEGSRRSTANSAQAQSASSATPSARPSALLRLARIVYRGLPEPLRQFWLWNSHFVNYNRKFSRFVLDNRNVGNILFADRYLYDVRVKYIVETERPSWLTRGYYRLHSALVPKPCFGFVLVDEPAAIVARKDELTEVQISRFIEWIVRILKKRGMVHIVIPVAGRTPDEIAREITRKLIELQGPGLILHMRAFVSRLEAADAVAALDHDEKTQLCATSSKHQQ